MSMYHKIAVFFLIAAGLISLDLYLNWGSFFDIADVHHETWIVVFIFGAIILWAVGFSQKKRRRIHRGTATRRR